MIMSYHWNRTSFLMSMYLKLQVERLYDELLSLTSICNEEVSCKFIMILLIDFEPSLVALYLKGNFVH